MLWRTRSAELAKDDSDNLLYFLTLIAKSTAPVTLRLVIEDVDKRKRIISSTHDASHLGLNKTNDMVAGKYYWPGLFADVKTYVSYRCLNSCETVKG